MQSFETFDDQDEAKYDNSFKELESYAVLKNCIHDLPEVYTLSLFHSLLILIYLTLIFNFSKTLILKVYLLTFIALLFTFLFQVLSIYKTNTLINIFTNTSKSHIQ